MPEFRFRAAAALELRSRQERTAAAVAASAEANLRAAQGHKAAAETERSTACEALAAQQRRGTDIETLLWHRNWISGLTAVVSQRGAEVDRQHVVAREAELAWLETRRKRLALERLRDRAWHRHQQREAGTERKTIDELARLRFTMRNDESDEEHFND